MTAEERAARAEATRAAADEPIPEDTLRMGDLEALYRDVKPGEARVEGTLTAVRCTDTGGAVFVLNTADGPQQLATPRLSDVDFITYRDDLAGTMTCGPLASPMRVYLTSRPHAAASGGNVVVAVEFLPK